MGRPAVPSDRPSLFRHISETIRLASPRKVTASSPLLPSMWVLARHPVWRVCGGVGAGRQHPHCTSYQKFGLTFLTRASRSQVTALHLQKRFRFFSLRPPLSPSIPLRSTGWGGLPEGPRLAPVPGPRPYTLQALRVHTGLTGDHTAVPQGARARSSEVTNATCVSVYLMFISGRAGGRPEPGEKDRLSGQHSTENCTQNHVRQSHVELAL